MYSGLVGLCGARLGPYLEPQGTGTVVELLVFWADLDGKLLVCHSLDTSRPLAFLPAPCSLL